MTTTTLTFTVPEQCRENFPHELELLTDFMGPLIGWLERHGGGMRVEVPVS
ncbi:hypothetical protein [Nocardia abscessus]|jgi:hypothetical protein|uniref:hypothetical protein n=1 Tax=Nocardia abscessus TaxID=120957 RepID=UPI0002FC6515|nr:hypothetical protein [Nocardia abscessus]MCC3333614.1 hypothetical protein [Nocardia abscessus]